MPTAKKGNKCAESYCSNETVQRRYCNTCRSRRMKDNNLVGYLFNVLKQHARERSILFLLSLPHYELVVTRSDYLTKRGRGAEDLTIDRIIPELGYIDGNIQVLTNSDNVKKRNRDNEIWPKRKYDHEQAKQSAGTPF